MRFELVRGLRPAYGRSRDEDDQDALLDPSPVVKKSTGQSSRADRRRTAPRQEPRRRSDHRPASRVHRAR